jgi:hypothetical protein
VNCKNVVLKARVLASTLLALTNLVDASVDKLIERYKNHQFIRPLIWQNVCIHASAFRKPGGCNENILDRISDRDRVPGELLCIQHAARLVKTRVGRKP